MNRKSRYEDLLQDTQILSTNAVELNKKLNHLGNHATYGNAKDVVDFVNSTLLYLDGTKSKITNSYKANWLTDTEYENLITELEKVISILDMLGVEV